MKVANWQALPILAALCAAPAVGQAHAILLDSQPAAGESIAAGPADLRLRFNSRIDAARSRLTLTRPDHSQAVLPMQASPAGNGLTASAEFTAGAWSLRWQVLALDGHITRGDVPFTVTGN